MLRPGRRGLHDGPDDRPSRGWSGDSGSWPWLALGAVLVPVVEPRIGAVPPGPRLAWLALTELLVGGPLGWSAALIVAGARQAGDLVAAQAGLSSGRPLRSRDRRRADARWAISTA